MRVALLHLDLAMGSTRANVKKLLAAIRQAARLNACWIVTPETAVQGYFFAERNNDLPVPVQPDPALDAIRAVVAEYGLTVFLGCAEHDPVGGNDYNSCLVLEATGKIAGRHRKLRSHGGAEAWAAKGEQLEPIGCGKLSAGVLICADSWYPEHAVVLKDKGAQILVVPAAWPPGQCGPGDCWERASAASGLPLWVCNQTGSGGPMDFCQAQSAVVTNGKTCFTYSGREAILLFDWDCASQRPLSGRFEICPAQ